AALQYMREYGMTDIFGYYDAPGQTEPTFDPGLDVLCPFCLCSLRSGQVQTVSLMLPGDVRCFFYRVHKECRAQASEKEIDEIEGALIDARAAEVIGGKPE